MSVQRFPPFLRRRLAAGGELAVYREKLLSAALLAAGRGYCAALREFTAIHVGRGATPEGAVADLERLVRRGEKGGRR